MRSRCLLVLCLLVGVALGACREKQDLEADTVRVRWSERTVELEVISCGLDGDLFLLAAESADSVVQMLLVLDGDAVDPVRSAVSVEVEPAGVLGAGSADLLAVSVGDPGEITEATIRGDRIDVDADARTLDQIGSPVVEIEIAARCPAVEEFV